MEDITPIFVFSLPRAGSTLTQRLLASHRDIASVAEPWLLLPLMSTIRSSGVYADYMHKSAVKGIKDMYNHLENGRVDFMKYLRDFTLNIYRDISNGEPLFLDKTPRYHLIAREIIETFPSAKFIFLWRNPLAIAASMMETWAYGKWNIYRHRVDLYRGVRSLTETYRMYQDKAFAFSYETLLENPESTLESMCGYLGISFDETILDNFANVQLSGRMGDPSGFKRYSKLSHEPLEKWRKSLRNPVRKGWALRYLKWIGESDLNTMGYSIEELNYQLKSTPVSLDFMLSDVLRFTYGTVHPIVERTIFKDKVREIKDGYKPIMHG